MIEMTLLEASFPRKRESRFSLPPSWIPARAGLRRLGRNDDQRNARVYPRQILFAVQAALVVTALLTLLATSAHAEKIRTAIPQANLNYLSIHVADAKGFFREEGLDNETVVISGPLSIAALLSGDVDFSGAGGSGMRAALKGAPVKGIMFQERAGTTRRR
jgi:ABC-type nitrate/sulfonate/bicarbonate transport system substrate-binding protein